MNRAFKFLLAAGVATCASYGAALAADLPVPAEALPPAAPAAGINWTGFYIGANAGWGFADADASLAGGGVLPGGFPGNVPAPPLDLNPEGGFAGGTVGFDFGMGNGLVLGVLGDYDVADLHDDGDGGTGIFATHVDLDIDQIASARGRLGWAHSGFLGYVTGGWSWAHVERELFNPALPGDTSPSADQWHDGWTAGGGIEYAITNRWSTKIEYLYSDLGSENYSVPTIPGDGTDIDLTMQTVKLGVNLRFGGGP